MDGESGLTMPPGVQWMDKGTTGMPVWNIKQWNWDSPNPGGRDSVMEFLIKQSHSNYYDGWVQNFWECEDFSYLAAADVRCTYPGQPIGIAIGTKVINGRREDHAINILWFQDPNTNKWETKYFDATLKEEGLQTFQTAVVIPLPLTGKDDRMAFDPIKHLEPARKSAAFDLYKKYDNLEARLPLAIGNIKAKLTEWRDNGIPRNKGPYDHTYYRFNDEVLNWFIQARREFKGLPIGMAVGISRGEDYAALVLWKTTTQFVYWSIRGGNEISPADFSPKYAIV